MATTTTFKATVDGDISKLANWDNGLPSGSGNTGVIDANVSAGGLYGVGAYMTINPGRNFAPSSAVNGFLITNNGTINAPGKTLSLVTNNGVITDCVLEGAAVFTNAATGIINGMSIASGTITNAGQLGGSGVTSIGAGATLIQTASTGVLTKNGTGTTTLNCTTVTLQAGRLDAGVVCALPWMVPGTYGKRATKNGNWSDTTVWATGSLPIAGDVVDLAGYTVAMDLATIPASGALAGIISPGTAGRLNIDTTASARTINAAKMVAGTLAAFGLLECVGLSANVLTVNGTPIGGTVLNAWSLHLNNPVKVNITGSPSGGSGANSYGLYSTSLADVTVTGGVIGGSGDNSVGAYHASAGIMNISGSATGGSASGYQGAFGLCNNGGGVANVSGDVIGGGGAYSAGIANKSGTVNLAAASRLIDSAAATAYYGKPPAWTPALSSYIQIGAQKFPPQLASNQVLDGVAHGDRTGNITLPAADNVAAGSGNFGPASASVPAYPTTATSKSQQRSDDVLEVSPNDDKILHGTTLLGIAGRYYKPSVDIVREGSFHGVDNLEEGTYDMAADVAAATAVAVIAAQKVYLDALVAGVGVGPGGASTTIICQVNGAAVEGVEVWVTSDAAGNVVIQGPVTSDALGSATLMLEANSGPFYVWRQHASYNFTNPITITWDSATAQYK